MGMDVYGIKPKQNKEIDKFPTLYKYDSMEFREKWKLLDKDTKLRETYWLEKDDYEQQNPGCYFRNNCWWWRPLWNYCYAVAPNLIDEETFEHGHGNSGAGLDDKGAKLLGEKLLKQIKIGATFQYQVDYEQYLMDLPDDDCMRCNNNNHGNNKKKDCINCKKTGKSTNFNKHYPFDIDNVKEFAEFCIQSGGFEIN